MEQLIKLNLEIEGLLRVLANRNSDEALALLDAKVYEFNAAYASLMSWKKDGINSTNDNSVAEDTIVVTADNDDNTDNGDIITPKTEDGIETTDNVSDDTKAIPDQSTSQTQDAETIRLDQMLTQRSAKDFTKAFTINDRYRFIRELFDNHPTAFDAALARIDAFDSLSTAYDYMLNDLEWDPENEAVKDFINIVSNHFNTI